ncbi:MAG: PAS domain S-box protein, partial [Pseudomonadota bacterium]
DSTLRFVHVNHGAQRNLGYSMEELAQMTPLDLKPDYTRESFHALLSALRDSDDSTTNFQTVHRRKDGSRYPVEVHLQHAWFDRQPVFVAIVLDITSRQETERSLAEARLLLELAPDATVIVNPEGTIEVSNLRMAEEFGYSQGELKGMVIEDLIPERFKRGHIVHRQRFSEAPRFRGMGTDATLFGLTKDGREIPIEVSLSPIEFEHRTMVAASIRNVTARKRVESALRASEERYRDLFDNANDLIQSVAPDGSFVFVNAAWRRTLGYTEDEVKSLRLDDILHPDVRGHCHAVLERVLAGDSAEDVEAVFVTRSGEPVYVEGSISCGRQDGAPVSTRAIFHNVTQRKRAEHALEEAKNLAENATAAKSRFLAAASHDLRQPLQSLGLYLSVLNRMTQEDSVLEISEKMRNSLDVMGELLDALLDISKLDSGSITPSKQDFPIQEMFDKLMADSEPDAAKKGLTLRCEASSCVLHTDPALLQRIVANFVGNAIRYTESGSVEVRCRADGDVARIEVADTGVGIPPEALESIFEEYFQLENPVRNRQKGLGLGLSIVRHIARLLEHQLHVSSNPGAGSTFAVDVPLGEARCEEPASAAPAREARPANSKTVVLFVDDDTAIVDATTLLLSVSGFEVHAALDGDAALAHIANGIEPDIVVSDYRLPGYNGIELIQRVRKATRPDLPCILMTGDTSAGEVDVDQVEGCVLLHKPVDTDRLVSLVGKARA